MANVLLLIVAMLLSGCTSSQVMSSGCDFVVGSAQSQQRQVQNHSLDSSETHQTANIINGFFSMLLGPIHRSLGDDQCKAEEQSYQYPSIVL
ncbi:hypothetical protein [Pseudoalteromonas rhizosphaerae]|uniref:hypothetical protein n=1 Tax=Pseudoalteromonas rhizosphaerae TaxID=2518973 RepID=UPI00384F206E